MPTIASDKLNKHFISYLKNECGVLQDQKILLAVSGGVDSMVMAHLFLEANVICAIAHVNFCLRAEDADQDEQFVKAFAQAHQIPFYSTAFDTLTHAQGTKQSIQMAARQLRMNWFNEIIQKEHYDCIAIATHANDKMESFFLNTLRGTGLKGLSGIQARRDQVIHPLLFASKKDILAYAKKYCISYREDASNAKNTYKRNAIRNQVIPVLEQWQPDLLEKIGFIQELAKEHQKLLDQQVDIYARKNVHYHSGECIITITPELTSLFLFELLKLYAFEYKQISKIYEARFAVGKKFTSKISNLWIERGQLRIQKNNLEEKATKLEEYVFDIDKMPSFLQAHLLRIQTPIDFSNKQLIYLDYNQIQGPFILRRWRSGDAFQPFGMKGQKKLSDYFVDKKISRKEKFDKWILCDQKGIIWLLGMTIDERVKVTEKTQQILRLEYLPSFD